MNPASTEILLYLGSRFGQFAVSSKAAYISRTATVRILGVGTENVVVGIYGVTRGDIHDSCSI